MADLNTPQATRYSGGPKCPLMAQRVNTELESEVLESMYSLQSSTNKFCEVATKTLYNVQRFTTRTAAHIAKKGQEQSFDHAGLLLLMKLSAFYYFDSYISVSVFILSNIKHIF